MELRLSMQVTNSAGSSKKDVAEHLIGITEPHQYQGLVVINIIIVTTITIMLTCQHQAGGSRCPELRPQSHIGTRVATSSMLASCRTWEVAIMMAIMMIMMMMITVEGWRVDGHHHSRG